MFPFFTQMTDIISLHLRALLLLSAKNTPNEEVFKRANSHIVIQYRLPSTKSTTSKTTKKHNRIPHLRYAADRKQVTENRSTFEPPP